MMTDKVDIEKLEQAFERLGVENVGNAFRDCLKAAISGESVLVREVYEGSSLAPKTRVVSTKTSPKDALTSLLVMDSISGGALGITSDVVRQLAGVNMIDQPKSLPDVNSVDIERSVSNDKDV